MIIELESPFKELWRKGYLRESMHDGRRRVDLYNSDSDRTTISYARYLVSVKLGYVVPDEFEVDHEDKDKTNDSLFNLQVLSSEEHRKKNSKEMNTGRTMVNLICPECKSSFIREIRLVHSHHGSSKNTFCSRQCNGRFSRKIQMGITQ